MSNLIFPTCTPENLRRIMAGKSEKQIAYATRCCKITGTDGYRIYHHGHKIAEFRDGVLYVTNAGWNSRTTSDRLHRIVSANYPGLSVCIRNGGMVMVNRSEDITLDMSGGQYITIPLDYVAEEAS